MTLDKKYLITGVDPKLYKDFKAACAYYDLSIRHVLINHMQNIVKDYQRARSEFSKRKIYEHKEVKKK